MVRFHKLAAIGMAITLSSVGSAFALGLGEVSWKSTLNQPLNAEIALYDVKNITNRELIVKLANPEDFDKAGIERPHALTDLVFTPVISNGKGIIKITSKNPIKEPYLDFLLSVSWSSGETLREYTLLIDPPAYVPATVKTTSVASVQQPKPKTVATEPKKSTPPAAKVAPEKKTKPSLTGNSVKAVRGDSLWAIAERARGNVSVHQAMLAIYEANPDAFIDGKMSLLKEGKVLRIPAKDQMRQQSRSEALAQVVQNVEGTSVATTRQVNASKNTSVADSGKASKDQLKLTAVSADKGKSDVTSSSSDKGLIAELSNKVSQTEEDLDATRRKNDELRSRMGDLESRLNDMKKLIELKDNQLAALQANIAKKSLPEEKDQLVDKQNKETAVQ